MGDLRHNNVTILWFFIICLLIASCGRKPVKLSQAERKALESAISSKRNIDTLIVLQKRMEKEGNILGSVIAYKEMGKLMRNDSQFDDALRWHSEGLKQAESIGDSAGTEQYRYRLPAHGSAGCGARLSLPRLCHMYGKH